MRIQAHHINDSQIAEVISADQIISNVEDALDLLGDLYYQNFDKIILREENIIPEFFELKSGIAGDILQKFSNYRVRIAIVGQFTRYTSKSFNDFVYESNKYKQINFVSSLSDALKVLSR